MPKQKLSIYLLALLSLMIFGAWTRGAAITPASLAIPVSSLSVGNFSANNWTGITSPATSVSTHGDGLKYIAPNPDSGQMLAIGNASWLDQEVTTYSGRGTIFLRMSSGNGLYFDFDIMGGGVSIGIVTGFISANPTGGTRYSTYNGTSGCITNWPTTGSHTFTFGVRGFTVYLKIDGVQAIDTCQPTTDFTGAITYLEYRSQAMGAGKPMVWVQSGNGARDVTITYFTNATLFSNFANNVFDPRDFGLRSISAVTGSMTASSNTLTLSSARDFRVGDQVIVEIGGESGAGARNTIGVGGVSPVLHYTDATARSADHSQPDGTYAYLDTDGTVATYASGTTTWTDQSGNFYYGRKTPLSLVATVTAVNASPATTLTLSTAASVSTTAANVYLDALPSFYPLEKNPASHFSALNGDGLNSYHLMSFTIPAGTWQMSNATFPFNGGARAGLTIYGQGIGVTTLQNPKGVPSANIDTGVGSTATVRDFSTTGNLADSGYGFITSGTNKQFSSFPIAITGGNAGTSTLTFQNIACLNSFRGCISVGGTNTQILNSTSTLTVPQRDYLQWQFQLVDCSGGQIANSTVTGLYLVKAFELFACTDGATITNTTGTNALYSINSSTNWALSTISTTIAANSYLNQSAGAIDEPVVSINTAAFGGGNTGTISNPRLIQSGYVDASNNSLKFIQITSGQTNVSITGQFPGGGGCSTVLGGFFQAPNYNAGSAEYGAMAVLSDAPSTTVSGIRIKGTAIGSPGLSAHYGNISITGATSSATNNVADVIQTGPTQSGNQTNAAYGGC